MRNDISIEEFDRPGEEHVFSKNYEKNKKNLLKSYRRELQPRRNTGRVVALAATAAALIVATPFVYYAATGEGIVSHIWPNTKESIVEELEQNAVYTPITRTFDDGSVLTIVGALSDGQGAVVEYTLSKPGGVDTYYWDEETNKDKGGWITDNSYYNFGIIGSGKTVVDPVRSTKECLYCYDYIILDRMMPDMDTDTLTLVVSVFPVTMGEWQDPTKDDLKMSGEWTMEHETIPIPLGKDLARRASEDANGVKYEISPISICVFGFYSPWEILDVNITLKDGTTFDAHATANYVCGRLDGGTVFFFDRVINVDDVESVQVSSRVPPQDEIVNETVVIQSEVG